jgi:hypothetical protein
MSQTRTLPDFLRSIDRKTLLIVDDKEIISLSKRVDVELTLRDGGGSASAPFDLQGGAITIVALITTVNILWEHISKAYGIGKTLIDFLKAGDSALELTLDHNKKLEIVERIIKRLKELGLSGAANKVEGWVNAVLDQLTKPKQQ